MVSPASATLSVSIDRSAAAPGTPDLQSASDTGTSDIDNVTKNASPTFDITSGVETGATVQLFRGGTALGMHGAGSIQDPRPLGNGNFSYTAKQTDLAGNLSAASLALSITVDRTAPSISGSAFIFDTLAPMSVQYTFSENVQPSLAVNDVTVLNQTTSATVDDASKSISYNSGSNVASLFFAGFSGGALPDGNYQNSIAAPDVTDVAGNALQAGNTLNYFFLMGDANRDKAVNTIDFNTLAFNFSTSNKTFTQGNFSYDATRIVDTIDFNLLASNFTQTLTAPAAAAALTGRTSGGAGAFAGLFNDILIGDTGSQLL